MAQIKLFYSYTRADECHREELEKHLSTLRNEGKIDEWHDRKIIPGSDIDKEINYNIETAHIILLLFSPDFISSKECQKEITEALRLKKEKSIKVIPIILRPCSWKEDNSGALKKLLALPKDAKPVTSHDDKDSAWLDVYYGLKDVIEEVEKTMKPEIKEEVEKAMKPEIKDDFKKELLANPITNDPLDKLFVYPDLLENDRNLKLEDNEVGSEKLNDLDTFGSPYILVVGEEQIGKTSLCSMLFLSYLESGFYPILINGKDIYGKGDILRITDRSYRNQYEPKNKYSDIHKEKRILFIDDIDEHKLEDKHFQIFISSIKNHFDKAIIFIDTLSDLCNKSSKFNYFPHFKNLSIRPSGHKRRDELIRKCISLDEGIEFDIENLEHLARLDKDTKHIDSIIGTNIVPSYPVYIVTIFHTVELATKQDFSQTSYGHCYQAIITIQLSKSNIKAEDIDAYFNFLTELAYLMFDKGLKNISGNELETFTASYDEEFIVPQNVVQKLVEANILKVQEDEYGFRYIYIYYYFVGRYIAQKIANDDVKQKFLSFMSSFHLKDNSNIIIFVAHHTKDKNVLEEITRKTMGVFDKFPAATLSGDEKNFIGKINEMLGTIQLPTSGHNTEKERDKNLKIKDEIESISEHGEQQENHEDSLLIEIRRAARSIEIIGQILKNQYGSLERDSLKDLFLEGQNAGLRLLKSFMEIMLQEKDNFREYIQSILQEGAKNKYQNLSNKEINDMTQKFVARFSYAVIFQWLHKIVDSLGYDKLIEIADEVNLENKTAASKLINLYIHTWYTKKLDLQKIKSLHGDFKKEQNHQAIYILKDIISHHIYMHPVKYDDKQRIRELLEFSVQGQVSRQQKLHQKPH